MDLKRNAEIAAHPKQQEMVVNPDVYIKIRQCLMQEGKSIYRPDIDAFCAPEFDSETVGFHLQKMMQRGEIRTKECQFEHDWEYRPGRNW